MGTQDALLAAASAWDTSKESLESVERRIHDRAPLEQLDSRADSYIKCIFELFPYVELNGGDRIMEIGSGVGYLMQGLARKLDRDGMSGYKITGLDISPSMSAKARERLGNDSRYDFVLYDGITVPLPDKSLDFIYSMAALQHVPKVYVYNLFFEIKRLLKPNSFAIIHLLPFRCLPEQNKNVPWREEIRSQINNAHGVHWHHFYTEEELVYVLRDGTGFSHVDARNGGEFVCVNSEPLRIPASFNAKNTLKITKTCGRQN